MEGYKGKLLFIDLSSETVKDVAIPEQLLIKYMGGRGLGAKLYWDLVAPEVEPLAPENIFMILSGPVGGTMVPGSGKHVIVCKSPTHGGWLESYSSGRITPEMKFAGYDGILITGKAKHPIYLEIEDDRVTFKDARFLWGKGSFETETYLREHFHPDAGTLTIGQAGENLIQFACVGSDYFRKAGRGGAGAVMGSKNLKGLAIKGNGGVECHDIGKIFELIREHHKKYTTSPIGQARHNFGTPLTLNITNEAGMLPTRNFSKGQFNQGIGKIDKDGVADATIADRACYACFSSCSKITQVKEGIFKGTTIEGPEYESIGLLGPNLEIDYLPAIIKANYICDDMGMDTVSAGGVIGFAMECFERGLLTKEDTDGLELTFGNYMAAVELLELMASNKGFGAFCAQGVKKMSEQIGKGSEAFAIHSKGMEFPAYDPRAGWGSTITYSTTPRGGCHRRAWPPMKEVLGGVYPFTTENKPDMVKEMMTENCVMHSLLVCDFPGKFIPLSTAEWCDYFNAVTGLNFTDKDMNHRGDLIETLIRRINLREGLGADDDTMPKRVLEEAHPEGPTAGKIIGTENFQRMKADYYAARGWDESGVPTPETLGAYAYDQDPVFHT